MFYLLVDHGIAPQALDLRDALRGQVEPPHAGGVWMCTYICRCACVCGVGALGAETGCVCMYICRCACVWWLVWVVRWVRAESRAVVHARTQTRHDITELNTPKNAPLPVVLAPTVPWPCCSAAAAGFVALFPAPVPSPGPLCV